MRFATSALTLLSFCSLGLSQNPYEYSEMEAQTLKVHNDLRTQFGFPALKWSDSLAAQAQTYSKNCVWEHSGTDGQGENLAAGYANASVAAQGWADEKNLYKFDGSLGKAVGHFTQMVWKETTDVGCGATYCDGILEKGLKSWFFVCRYTPPGNWAGDVQRIKDNVNGAVEDIRKTIEDTVDGGARLPWESSGTRQEVRLSTITVGLAGLAGLAAAVL